jgi:thiol-disulfide isomerase/thioredoxin
MATAGMAGTKRAAQLLLLAGCIAWCVAPARGAPSVEQMLRFSPRQQGVNYTTPSGADLEKCKVELIKGQGKGSGWLLRDPNGQPLRLFFDTNGDNKLDVWSYYKDGAEVYREIDTTFKGGPDQYRWLNSGGMKWGIDESKDGHIKSWKAISAEEVSQEILQALINKDYARFEALLITDAEIKALELPADQAARLRELRKNAADKFQDTASKLTTLTAKANWIHLETQAPQCVPADQTGARYDLVKHAGGTILYEVGGKNDWIQTGEMIHIGSAWRLTDAPLPGATVVTDPSGPGSNASKDPEVMKLIDRLTALDKEAPPTSDGPGLVAHHLRRADLLEELVAKVKPEERDPWIRQVGDSLSTAASKAGKGDKTAVTRLVRLEQTLAEKMPGSNLAAYVTFREMQADYSLKIDDAPNFAKVQGDWLERLTKFVQAYPQAEDTPDALLQLGMVSEFLSKDVEAKNWYAKLKKDFPDKPQAQKAAGAVRRLELEGQPLKIAAPLLNDANVAFDIDELKGKVIVVYYWASWNTQSVGDFTKLKALLDANKGAGVELVAINLDGKAEEAKAYISRQSPPGTHLYQTGGLEGKLATDYGVMVLPQVFLVGKDGKVVNRNVQINALDEEIKKLLK